MLTRFRVLLATLVLAGSAATAVAAPDTVLTWNAIAAKTFVTQGQSPFAQARLTAIVQLAVFEAVNAVTGDYEPYLGIVAPAGTSADVAAATAAFTVLKHYFPAAPEIDAAYALSLNAVADGPPKANGITVGQAAAAAMIANRDGDGSTPATISPVGLPAAGVWQVTLPPGCAAGATGGSFYQWKDVRPFGVPDVEAFRPAAPPLLTSTEFAKSYNETKLVGASTSTVRPLDRADVARFYAASSPSFLFSMAARQIAEAEGRSLSENARDLALINMATSDSLVASFSAKYFYNFWRPENAIRFTDPFGNAKTTPDPGYVPFITTPCFPSYPSNHASGSNGAAEVMRRLYGEGGHTITLTNTLNAGIANLVYHYTTFNQICDDVDDARIYGGIHFRFDQVVGGQLGREIATYVYKHNLKKIHGQD